MAGFWKPIKNFFSGTPEKRENVSTLRPEQEPLFQQGVNAGLGPGAGGAFGEAADYYRNNLSDNPSDFNAFAAPAMRQYNEQISPGISEQFAGMGSGGLSSSGFRNAQVQGGVDLSERLGALRAQLRQNSAQGLQNIGQIGLGNYSQNMPTQQGSEGFISQAAPLIGAAGGFALGGPAGAAAGYTAGTGLKSSLNQNRNTSAYQGGNNMPASPQMRRGF